MSNVVRSAPVLAEILRNRLLATLGLSLAAGPGCWWGKCEPTVETTTLNLDEAEEAINETGWGYGYGPSDSADTGTTPVTFDACPTDPDQATALIDAMGGTCRVDEILSVTEEGRDCTYEYECWTCCGYGRPYLDEGGQAVRAETAARSDWTEAEPSPEAAALSAEDRAAIGRTWRETARSEHSSVAGFHRFALDLLTHGAPPALVARAQRAAMQELRHAIDAFTLASAYLGEPVGPAPLGLGAQAPIARDLAELAAWTMRDGAIGETVAAFLAGCALAETTDPAARAALETVVADETEHAELAWATLRWAIAVGGDPVRAAIAEVLRGMGTPKSGTEGWSPAQRAHGVADPRVEEARAAECLARVVRPVAAGLLGATEDTGGAVPHGVV